MKSFLISTCFFGILSAGPIRPDVAPVTLPDDTGGTAIESPSLSLGTPPPAPTPGTFPLPVNRASILPTSIIPVDTPEPGTLPAVGLAVSFLAWKLRSVVHA